MGVLFGNKTVTVYNRHYDTLTETEIWIPTLLEKVNLVLTKGANISQSGVENSDSAKVFVDVDEQSKPYVKPKEWNNSTLDRKKETFTFQPETDFFVEGDTAGVPVLEDGFFEHMQKHFDNVFHVSTVDEYKDVMKHLEVGGK